MTLLLVYLAIAIGVSFLCSVLEAVLLSITPSYLEQLSQERPKSGKTIQSVKDRLDESLSSILILNTFAHTMGAAGVGAQALRVFGPEAETLIAVLLTLAILYFSEIIPKTLGATYWRHLVVPAAFTIRWLVRLVFPLVWISTRLTQVLGKSHKDEITREEILALIRRHEAESGIVYCLSRKGVEQTAAFLRARGVDALRDEIVDMAEKKEVDDALMAILTGNAANAEAEGDQGRAKFLYKVAEVCLREKKNAGSGSADEA